MMAGRCAVAIVLAMMLSGCTEKVTCKEIDDNELVGFDWITLAGSVYLDWAMEPFYREKWTFLDQEASGSGGIYDCPGGVIERLRVEVRDSENASRLGGAEWDNLQCIQYEVVIQQSGQPVLYSTCNEKHVKEHEPNA